MLVFLFAVDFLRLAVVRAIRFAHASDGGVSTALRPASFAL